MNTEDSTNNKILTEIISWTKTIVITIIAVLFVTNFVLVNAYVPSGSMENTIMTGDNLIANRLSYLLSEPERGDIIVFEYPDDPSVLYVKRIIGLPGETIDIQNGGVYINGELLEEDYLAETMYGEAGPYVVPENCYFMMGDNRNISLDSRVWDKTYLEEDAILGKVMFRYFPSPKWYWDHTYE